MPKLAVVIIEDRYITCWWILFLCVLGVLRGLNDTAKGAKQSLDNVGRLCILYVIPVMQLIVSNFIRYYG